MEQPEGDEEMAHVKSAFEKAMEKIQGIEPLSAEEKEQLREAEKVKSVLAAFFKGDIDKDGLWTELKGLHAGPLREAQLSMVDTLRFGSSPEDLRKRRDGILAVENLKENKNAPAIENALGAIGKMTREYAEMKEQALNELRQAIEANPQLRMQPTRSPDGRTMYQARMSVDEAVQTRMAEFLSEQDKRYQMMFNRVIEQLKREIK